MSMKILFMGTPDFALFSLRALVEAGEDIIGVVTQPDWKRTFPYISPTPCAVKTLLIFWQSFLPTSSSLWRTARFYPQTCSIIPSTDVLTYTVLSCPRIAERRPCNAPLWKGRLKRVSPL